MIDLHVHTVNSDGDFTTEETLVEAEKSNIEILSFTDHNCIKSYDDLKEINISQIYTGKIIAGTELEFVKDGRLFDMLGYGFDIEILKKAEIIKNGMEYTTVEKETEILNKFRNICDRLGIKYSNNLEIKAANNMANDVILDDILTYSENKTILDNMGIYDRTTFYRQHVCEPKSPFYIDQTKGKFDIFEVTKAIHEAGGKTFLAHPFVYKLPNLKEFLDEIVSYNIIDGIECEHRKHTEQEIEWIKQYCDQHGLLKSGGSDRHTSSHKIGYASRNTKPIQIDLVKDWINKVKLYEV